MNQITRYRLALYVAVCALLLLGFAYKCEHDHVARLIKWGDEDARIIMDQEARIEVLEKQLTAEKLRCAEATGTTKAYLRILREYEVKIADLTPYNR